MIGVGIEITMLIFRRKRNYVPNLNNIKQDRTRPQSNISMSSNMISHKNAIGAKVAEAVPARSSTSTAIMLNPPSDILFCLPAQSLTFVAQLSQYFQRHGTVGLGDQAINRC